MSALRRKKGNIVIALLSFLSIVAFVFLSITFSLYNDANITLIDLVFKTSGQWTTKTLNYNFDMLKNIDFKALNYVYVVALIGPFVTTFLTLFLKRFRFINTINFIVLLFSFIVLMPSLVIDFSLVSTSIKALTSFGIIAVACLGASTILAYINLQLCR